MSDTVHTDDARVDLDRVQRCGAPEVIYGPGKSPATILEIIAVQQAANQPSLVTRVTEEQGTAAAMRFPHARWNPLARTIAVDAQSPVARRGRVGVITAGTSDRPVAEEAWETAHWMGCETELLLDLGVAGPQRILAERDRLAGYDALVVVAGMEGALPSVVGGWVKTPVIAVPTSVGYGANLGGWSALLSMLNSCAANVAVVNIDAGFKGGYLAGLIARNVQRPPQAQ